MYRLVKPIVLCGFMASGKTTVGKLAARRWNLPIYDTDKLIVSKTGKSISAIFAEKGEAFFRDVEHEICREVADYPPCIISSGGGLLTYSRNGDLLQGKTVIVLLNRDFDTIWSFLSNCTDRPLVTQKKKDGILALYESRIPLYRKYADFEIENTSGPEKCVDILEQNLMKQGVLLSEM